MPHSNITRTARDRARTLRREMTKAERAMWDILREFRSFGSRFRRETPIGPYICDFAWLSARLIVEVDGDSHEQEPGKRHDKVRDRFLTAQGFRVLRFENDLVLASPDFVKSEIEAALPRAADNPSRPLRGHPPHKGEGEDAQAGPGVSP